jgi:predicted Rossmann fold flavoprotein
MLPALELFYGAEMRKWFQKRQVSITLDDDFHYFPASRRAGDVLACLLREAELCGVQVVTGCAVSECVIFGGRLTGVRDSEGRIHPADAVILASGGRGYTALGGGTSGYRIAELAGHSIVTPFPGLTGLQTVEAWPGECAGLSLPDVEVRIDLPRETMRGRGELLFTRQGISAFAVLDLAGRVAELLAKHGTVPLSINLMPGRSKGDWQQWLAGLRKNSGSKELSKVLAGFFPKRLALLLAGADDGPVARLTASGMDRLLNDLTGLTLNIRETDGWERAMVTHGGVKLKEIEPATLASRLLPGLFFAGEVVDLDGPCGGYNLSWAMASGMLAGRSAGQWVCAPARTNS